MIQKRRRCINCKHLNMPYSIEERKSLLESFMKTKREEFVVCPQRGNHRWGIFQDWPCPKYEAFVIRDGFYE